MSEGLYRLVREGEPLTPQESKEIEALLGTVLSLLNKGKKPAFIVRACNAHDELVAVCEAVVSTDILPHTNECPFWAGTACQCLRADLLSAIAKAKPK